MRPIGSLSLAAMELRITELATQVADVTAQRDLLMAMCPAEKENAHLCAQLARAHEPGDCDALALIMQRENAQLRVRLAEYREGEAVTLALLEDRDTLRVQLAQRTAALQLALEWASAYPLTGYGTAEDQHAANSVYDVASAALADLPDAPKEQP